MADQKFQVGDTVRLKSGGPVMTVRMYDEGVYSSVYYEDGRFHGLDEYTWLAEELLDKVMHDPYTGWIVAE
jgi:uncharacterized protein YodC (DUF2158 family)